MDSRYQNVKLMIGTPCYGGAVHVEYMMGLLEFARFGVPTVHSLLSHESLITRARNTIVAQFLSQPDVTHLLFIDSDIGFRGDAILRLLDANKPIVSGVYPHKALDWDRIRQACAIARDGQDLQEKSLSYVATAENLERLVHENGFLRVLDAPTGFMLIQRKVFDILRERYPELRYSPDPGTPLPSNLLAENFWLFFDTMVDPQSKRYLSEDYAFCRRWQAAGGEVWIDLKTPLTHVGRYAFRGNIAKLFNWG